VQSIVLALDEDELKLSTRGPDELAVTAVFGLGVGIRLDLAGGRLNYQSAPCRVLL